MKEENIRAGCNLSVVIVMIGIFQCTITKTEAGAVAAFAVMSVGIAGGIFFGRKWEKKKTIIRE